VVVPAGALKTDGQNSLLESKQLNKKMCSIIQVIPIPRLQAILNNKGSHNIRTTS
jgi:hypothetical protein